MAGNTTNRDVQIELHNLIDLVGRYGSIVDQLLSRTAIVSLPPESIA